MTQALAPVILIDLNDQASPEAAERAVRACNEAIAFGQCVAESTELPEPPLAVAIVRLAAGDRIRIELGRRDQQPTSWRVRELWFHSADPELERWRAVGLAIATLFGESEPQPVPPAAGGAASVTPGEEPPRADESAAPGSIAAPSIEPAEVGPSRRGAEPVARPPELADFAGESPARHTQWAPQPSTGAFVGLGIVAGPALRDFGLRWGGSARLGWVSPEGWLAALSLSYSRHGEPDSGAVSWLHLAAAVGRRFELGPVWGAALSVGGGAREIGFEAEEGGISARSRRWNPFGTVSGELWRHVGGGLALWAALDVDALAAESQLFVAGRERFVLPPIDAVALLGLRWMP